MNKIRVCGLVLLLINGIIYAATLMWVVSDKLDNLKEDPLAFWYNVFTCSDEYYIDSHCRHDVKCIFYYRNGK